MLYVALTQAKHFVDLQILKPLSDIVLKYFQPGNVHLAKDNSKPYCLMDMFGSCIMGKIIIIIM